MVHSPQPSARSPSFNPTSIGYPCSIQEADNAPATPSGVRAPVSGGGHLPRSLSSSVAPRTYDKKKWKDQEVIMRSVGTVTGDQTSVESGTGNRIDNETMIRTQSGTRTKVENGTGVNNNKKLGFIYEASNGVITIEDASLEQILLTDSENQRLIDELNELANSGSSYRMWAQAFLICDQPLIIVNVSCEGVLPEVKRDELSAALAGAARRRLPLAVFGDFGAPDNVKFLEEVGQPLIGGIQTTTDVTAQGGSNIVTNKGVKAFNGIAGCVRAGLTHLAIPKGWSWGGPVSPHCPVWAEYNVE